MTTKRDKQAQARRERLAGTRRSISDAVRNAAQEQHKKDKAQVVERAEEMVEEGRERRESLGVNRNAALTGGSYAGYSKRLGGGRGRDAEDESPPNAAQSFGALGRRRRRKPGVGRPPWA